MKAIIPVAGVGSRLRPHTFSHPKVLLNVAGKPIIGHIMDKLIAAGIDEAIVIVGYLGDMVEEWLTKNYSIKFTFVTQTELLGLAHAIWMCKPYVIENEPLFIILGDTMFDVDLDPVLKSPFSTLGVKVVDDPRRFGVAITDGEKILKLVEKPDTPVSNLAIVGLYFLLKAGPLFASINYLIDNDIKTKGEYQLTNRPTAPPIQLTDWPTAKPTSRQNLSGHQPSQSTFQPTQPPSQPNAMYHTNQHNTISHPED